MLTDIVVVADGDTEDRHAFSFDEALDFAEAEIDRGITAELFILRRTFPGMRRMEEYWVVRKCVHGCDEELKSYVPLPPEPGKKKYEQERPFVISIYDKYLIPVSEELKKRQTQSSL